jgi:hypothetical protein
MNTYFRNWSLKTNPRKTEVCTFHLNNRQAHDKLEIELDGISVRHNFLPKYLGVTLNRSLTYNEHLSSLSKNIRSQVNLIQMFTRTGWNIDAKTL